MPSSKHSSASKPSVRVIGGGLAGLSAAYELHKAGCSIEVHEAAPYWGGKIISTPVGERLVDAGPDTFLARSEETVQLCEELGIKEQLTAPVAKTPAYICRQKKLYPFPKGAILGVPTDIEELKKSGLVSAEAVKTVTKEPELPASIYTDATSIGDICRERLGDEITNYLIDPLVGGINASTVDQLCLKSSTPLFTNALNASNSLLEGIRTTQKKPQLGGTQNRPVFFGLPNGIQTLTQKLAEKIPPSALHLNSTVGTIENHSHFDAVVLATPTYHAASLLRPSCPETANQLDSIHYASVAQVTVEYKKEQIRPLLDTAGIIFPRVEGFKLSACTWLSSKWAHYQTEDTVLLRLTTGRFGSDEHTKTASDAELADLLIGELATVLSIQGKPLNTRVHRWPRSFPQYNPGHAKKVQFIVDSLQETQRAYPLGIHLAGAAYTGIGIPACIQSGRKAAQNILTQTTAKATTC